MKNLIIVFCVDDEDTVGEVQSFISGLGGEYTGEDSPEIYFSIPGPLCDATSLKGLNCWERQISSVILEDPDTTERNDLTSELRKLWGWVED